ncbi:putative multidrug resistance protein [Caenibius tardaugens NBRC 16725]|uniref:Multidrug-efflux transporter n=2 Tax=Caenibius TaxID=2827482 RepID=U2Y3F0_9SPHN|nr:putative multidrug resistance protein [Caenibius tardaugens NBRC 16725]
MLAYRARLMSAAAQPSSFAGELKATLLLAAPLAAANLLQMAVHAVDVIFVARLGQDALAAASLSISLFGLLMWAFSGLTGAVAPLIAAELGKGRHAVREIRRSVRMALWLAVLSGLFGMAICGFGGALLAASGQDPVISELAGGFLRVLMWGMIPMIMANVLRTFVAAMGRPIFATLITAAAIGVNILANWVFVFGGFGVPAMGLNGSAVASVVTSVCMFLAYLGVVCADRRFRRYYLFGRFWRPETKRLKEITLIGLPIAGTILAEAGLFSSAALLMGWIGKAELASHTIALQIAAFAFQIPFGVGQAATIRVGYHFGAGNRAAIGHAGRAAIMVCVLFSVVTACLLLFAPRLVISAYVDIHAPANAVLVSLAVQYLAIGALFQLFDGTQAVVAGALRGLQDTKVPMAIAIFGYWLPGMGSALWLAFHTPLRGAGVWFGFAIGLAVVAVLLLYRWHGRERLNLVAQLP